MRYLLFLLALALPAQTLPWSEAESLAGKKAALPGVWAGRPAVVVWSFSREAGDGVKEWMTGLEKEGIQAWSVAMLEAAPRLIRPLIRSGMRKQAAAGQVERWLCLYKGEKDWRAALGVADDKLPVVVVVNRQGGIAWKRAGRFEGGASEAVRQQMQAQK